MTYRSRIVGWDIVPPDQLLAHPLNARTHPPKQRDALRGSLDELGWIAPVIVSKTTGHVVDGHARIEEALTNGCDVPVAYVDLTESEEALALATLDTITTLAVPDKERLDALLREVKTNSVALQEMLAEQARNLGLHQQELTKEEKRALVCPECGYVFS